MAEGKRPHGPDDELTYPDGHPAAVMGRLAADDGYSFEEDVAEMLALNAAAHALAPRLIGLTQAEAQQLVDAHDGITVEFRQYEGQHALYGIVGGIFAYLRRGRVIKSCASGPR